MMLRTLLPGIHQRYAFVGSALGALLPLFSFTYEAIRDGGAGLLLARLNEPVHALMALMPVLFGLIFYRFGRAKAAIVQKLRARKRAERSLLALSLNDQLTGLPNRLALEKEIARFLDVRRKGRFRPALLLLDLDKFKHVNDTLGHDAGDELLRTFAGRLRRTLGPSVGLFRLGGDEFVVSVAGCPEVSDIDHLCRVIEAEASLPFDLAAGKAITGVSIGVTWLENTDLAHADLIKRADIALYSAKDIIGSAHAIYNKDMAARMVERVAMEQDIAKGLADGAFFLEYQPIINAADRKFTAFEALVRWRHPVRGIIQPDGFLTVAARTGHIIALDRWVIAQAISDATEWPASVGLAVNVTGDDFKDPGFPDFIKSCLAAHDFAPSRLTVEITESIFMVELETVRVGLSRLREIGVLVALDDFGAGFSSINHLLAFPIDRLKIDRSFTQDMMAGDRNSALIDIILKLGRVFEMATVVEGVENEDQLDLVRALGAAEVQGFLISRPVPAGAVAMLLAGQGGDRRDNPRLALSA